MLGEALSIGSALTWALAVVLFKRGLRHPPEATNLFKNVFALALLAVTLAVLGLEFPDRSEEHWLRLAVSGVLGIAVADTLFFAALSRVGAGYMGVIACAYAPFVVLFSVLLLDEVQCGLGRTGEMAGWRTIAPDLVPAPELPRLLRHKGGVAQRIVHNEAQRPAVEVTGVL